MTSKITIYDQEISYFYEQTNHKYTLLFLHGFASSKMAVNSLAMLKNRNYNIIAFDYPGFGNSKTQKEQNLENYQQITKEFIKKVVPNNTVIMGHSLGCFSAVAIHNNPKIIDIFLMSGINPWNIKQEYVDLISLLLPLNVEDAKLALSYVMSTTQQHSPSFEKAVEFFMKTEPGMRKLFYNLLVKQVLNKEYLEKYIQPLFLDLNGKFKLIHGDKDYMIPIEGIRKLSKKLNVDLFEMKNIGHSPIFENPNALNDYLVSYFQSK